MEKHTLLIVGGGPVGLYAANLAQEKGFDYLLLESTSSLGGQANALYPEKPVVDVKEFSARPAKEIVKGLVEPLKKEHLHLEETVQDIKEGEDGVVIKSDKAEYLVKDVIIATGLGFYSPRPLGVDGEKDCHNILYSLKNPSALKGQTLAIFGGGDSALDWAKHLSSIADVSLVHRRTEFRGNPDTIKDCKLHLYLPYIPKKLTIEGVLAKEITISNVQTNEEVTLPVDTILVNYGLSPLPSTFGLPLSTTGFGVLSDEHSMVKEHLFVAGDCSYKEEKKKRIEPGFEEVRKIFEKIL